MQIFNCSTLENFIERQGPKTCQKELNGKLIFVFFLVVDVNWQLGKNFQIAKLLLFFCIHFFYVPGFSFLIKKLFSILFFVWVNTNDALWKHAKVRIISEKVLFSRKKCRLKRHHLTTKSESRKMFLNEQQEGIFVLVFSSRLPNIFLIFSTFFLQFLTRLISFSSSG